MECGTLYDYISGRLDEADRVRFEQHLTGCAACRREHQLTTTLDTFVEEWSSSKRRGGPSLAEADALVERVKGTRPDSRRIPLLGWVGAAAGAAAALVIAFFFIGQQNSIAPLVPSAPAPVASAPSGLAVEVGLRELVEGESLKTSEAGEALAVVGNDLLGVGHSSHIEVVETKEERIRLNLRGGHAVFDVRHRTAGSYFSIQVGVWSVRVIGTRFGIVRDENGGMELTVGEGVVQVLQEDELLGTVTAGGVLRIGPGRSTIRSAASDAQLATIFRMLPLELRALYLGDHAEPTVMTEGAALEREVTKPGSAAKGTPRARRDRLAVKAGNGPVERSRQALLAGDYAKAQDDLEAHLKKVPGDHRAWSLLGDCRRKLDAHQPAVAAYEQAIRLGNNGEANRARFMAATVLQSQLGDHHKAAELFESYIAQAHGKSSMYNVAKLRLARSYAALGATAQAKKHLKEIIIDDPKSFVARNARKLLGELTGRQN